MSILKKIPSQKYIIKNAINTCKRFPFTLLSALIGTCIALLLSEKDSISEELVLQKILMVVSLGLPMFTALAMFAERSKWDQTKSIILQMVGVILLVGYYFILPEDVSLNQKDIVRHLLLGTGLHFLVAFLPFLKGKEIQGFWQYNKSMFISFLTAYLYSNVMGIGLLIALASADHLFGIDVKEIRYFQIWIIIAGVFHTLVFLAKLPDNLDALNTNYEYPKGLKIFTQYILLPLVGLYLVILYSYEIKIIFQWNWPKGWVSNLVLWYSVVSILSLLLLHPLKDKLENKWIKDISKWFFRGLIPLVIMLLLAIIRRISDYGVTEPRYFVLAMAIGLSIVVLYFVFSKLKDIRIIPIVICLIAFLSSFGPWGAFSVSQNNQQNRLESLLIENNLLNNGVLVTPESAPEFEQRKEMSSIVRYIEEWHGIEPFEKWLDSTSIAAIDTVGVYISGTRISGALGFVYVDRWGTKNEGESFTLKLPVKEPLNILDYDYLFNFSMNYSNSLEREIVLDDKFCFVRYDNDKLLLEFLIGHEWNSAELIYELLLIDSIRELNKKEFGYKLIEEDLSFRFSTNDYDFKLILPVLEGWDKTENYNLNNMEAVLLLKKK